MQVDRSSTGHHGPRDEPRPAPALAVAALASLGAGAIHAVAAGAHSEHRTAVWTFVALAVAQIGWGALALRAGTKAHAAAGAALAIVALAGWAAAKTTGIPVVDGLGDAEAVQWADGLAAGLALVALLGSLVAMFGLRLPAAHRVVPVAAVALVAASVGGMALAGDHAHEGSHGDDVAHADDHTDGSTLAHADDVDHDANAPHADDDAGHDDATHEAAVVPPAPYDPALPIDLSGVDGVSPQQQAAAENLIAVTLLRLPQFADPAEAEARGWRSIGDGFTGYEHYVNWDLVDDDVVLDPDQPESLVYQVIDGEKTLVAAMFMLPDGVGLDEVPELGGRLTQWHVHDDLCYTPDPVAPRVAGLREPGGPCGPGLVPGRENAMIHVWIVPHECGPFAALEGVGGGTIAEGEERWCDHAHGA
ncbi:hypothetical protein [Actinomarinicola tropica]|uniref:Uncharacterized protein n=1 Tax=Actinomarinicola tropica TaxID=2789776 RepID=A0A5Q2RHA8_9ACTN|nr:hypothetical protein [Actinomarinicola tropica]QGG96228.1 hypothetical protein GH723_14570 [Actinomarinicola tropica]